MTKFEVAGRTIVITGAAGGLGQLLADALRSRGANLALLDLDGDAVATQAAALGGAVVARGWRADVRDLEGLQVVMDEVADHFGRIDVVIAGAGIGNVVGSLAATEETAFQRAIDINLLGAWRTFKAAAPFVQQQRGHMMAIASMASFVHSPLHGSYTASKAGVWALCNSLRLEFRHLGVTVGSVHPAFFKTPMVDEALGRKDTMRLWNDFEGLFELISADSVVKGILKGIEQRSAQVVAPRRLRAAALAPGLMRLVIDRFGFPGNTVAEAIELGSTP
ncbi:SDR family NAD(P)-dependent oxidoreductase [Rhodococcus sp. WS4]|nr:SDR family NAD(P)-dependent oxidoreductase [Rhodococcus sp. WS4]